MTGKDWRLVINLANSVCGVALLALPHCFSQCGVVLGTLLLLASAYLTIQSCKLLVKVIFHTNCYTYEGIALQLFGVYGKIAMEISSIGLMLGTCSAFFVIVTDLAPVLVAKLLWVEIDPFQLRLSVSLLLGVFVVFPLCLLKRLESLSYLSAVSLLFYTSLAIQLLFLSLDNMSNEETLEQVRLWRMSGIFNIIPIFALAFSCHLQLCHMIGELPDPTLTRMSNVVKYALSTVGLVYGSMALFGHIAFCTTEVKGDILSNFGDNLAAQITRIGFTVAVLISFPFMVTPCRACIYSVLFSKGGQGDPNIIPQTKFIAITACIVCFTWFIAVTTPNVEIVLSLTGSISGSIVCFVFPALAYMALPSKSTKLVEWKSKLVLGMGLLLMIGGSVVVISDRYNDEGAVAAIHELAGAPDPLLQQLLDDHIQDGKGDSDHDQDKEILNNEGVVQALPVDPQKNEDGANPPDRAYRDFPGGGMEEELGKGRNLAQLDTKTLSTFDFHDENADQPKPPNISSKEMGSPENAQQVNPPVEKENLKQEEPGKVISDKQEEVLGQQKQVLHEQRQVSDQQEKVSDRQEIVSDQLKVISDQQKQVVDQQKEVSEKQEQILSKHQRVSVLNQEVSNLKNHISELEEQVSDLVSDKNLMSDESSPTIGSADDTKKQKKGVMKVNGKLKLKGLDLRNATLLTEDRKKMLHNTGKKSKKKKLTVD